MGKNKESLEERLTYFRNDKTCKKLLRELRSKFSDRDIQVSAIDIYKNENPPYIAYMIYGISMDELLVVGNVLQPGYRHRVGDDSSIGMPFELLSSDVRLTTTYYQIDITELEV